MSIQQWHQAARHHHRLVPESSVAILSRVMLGCSLWVRLCICSGCSSHASRHSYTTLVLAYSYIKGHTSLATVTALVARTAHRLI